jgi:4-hydroxy-tetrahydrodipicolinate synthase
MATSDFRGVYPILPTPFADDESLDLASLARTVRFMARIGVQGLTVLGVLGESNRLTDAERGEVVAAAVAAGGPLPVIVGASHAGTRATVDLAGMAGSLGAAAVMVAPSHEPVPGDERVLDYYRRVGDAAGLPLVLQDHPASTQVHMPVPLIARIAAEVPAVACIKEEGLPTPARIDALRRALSRPVPILTGLGALYGLFDLEQGSDGFNTGFAFPEALLALVSAARAGDWPRARDLYRRFLPLIVFEQQPGVAVRKEIFRRRGLLASARVRHPGAALAPSTGAQLDALLAWILGEIDLTAPLAL